MLARYLRPPSLVTVDVWQERFRHLPKGTSAQSGPWRNERTPYLVEPQRMLTDPACRAVVMMKASQTGGTEVGVGWFGRQIHVDPAPLMWCTSTEAQLGKISRRRFDPLLDRAPLRPLVSRRKGRDASRTTASSSFEGGQLTIVTANSPSSLSSDPIRDLVFDEVDRYRPSAGEEGDPIELGLARQTTFELAGAKTLYISSPALEGASRIALLYEQSDQRRYWVPCPECEGLQELVWFGRREDGHRFGVLWDPDVPKERAPETAYYGCEFCDARWSDAQRWAATRLESGARWIPNKPFSGVAGYYFSQLHSSFVRLAEMCRAWLNAQGRPEQQKTFWNTRMGLPFSLTADKAPDVVPKEAWTGFDVPSPACILLGFTDVQSDRLELSVAGFGADETVYMVEHRIFHGPTDHLDVWRDLERILLHQWSRSDGKVIGLSAIGVDCGYRFELVCDWAAQIESLRVYPIKGVGQGVDGPIVKARVASQANSGRAFYVANSDASKLQVIQRLQLTSGPGRIRFPARECFGDAYTKQMRSERLQRRYVRGYPVLEWHLAPGARNEALDCLAGIFAVQQWLNPALDVLEHTNERIADPPERPSVSDVPAPSTPSEWRPGADAPAPRARALEVPSAPAIVHKRGGSGAWFDGSSPGRRRA